MRHSKCKYMMYRALEPNAPVRQPPSIDTGKWQLKFLYSLPSKKYKNIWEKLCQQKRCKYYVGF